MTLFSQTGPVINDIANSICPYLKFTSVTTVDYPDGRMPSLDLRILREEVGGGGRVEAGASASCTASTRRRWPPSS